MCPPELVCLYRAVSRAELEDVRATGELRSAPNAVEGGKHLWATLGAARAFRDQLARLEMEPVAEAILEVGFDRAVVGQLVDLGPSLDGCGQGYFAEQEQLTFVRHIIEVEE